MEIDNGKASSDKSLQNENLIKLKKRRGKAVDLSI